MKLWIIPCTLHATLVVMAASREHAIAIAVSFLQSHNILGAEPLYDQTEPLEEPIWFDEGG